MKNLWQRTRLVVAALVMLAQFVPVVLAGVALVCLFIPAYWASGSPWLYRRIVAFGSALDQAANVVLFDGDPRETVSSHVGRFYEAKYGNPIKGRPFAPDPELVLTWQCRYVKWLTDIGERDHVYHAVEQWAVDLEVPL